MATPNHNEQIRSQLLHVFAEATLTDASDLDTHAELATIGVDSILAQQLAKMISQQFNISFSPVLLFEQLCIEGVYEFLCGELPAVIDSKVDTHASDSDMDEAGAELSMQSADVAQEVAETSKNEALKDDAIVMVGMACRLPQIDDIDAFWKTLHSAEPTLTTTDRWGSADSQFIGGFVNDVDVFDAEFFRISPAEASCMDPQQRIMMEVVQHSIDDSLLSLHSLRELDCGVITTSLPGDYKFELAKAPEMAFSSYSFSGNAFSTLSGRISYFYDLHGPSVSLDTACSSGLLGVHYAAQCLRAGDCDAVLVAGATVFATPEIFRFSANANMSSASGHCAAFSSAADGFVPAEGAVSVLLTTGKVAKQKQLSCYAEIAAIATNHDGKSNGLMAPNAQSQRQLIERLYQRQNIAVTDLAYIETHGTGTALGDPIEIKGLTDAFTTLGLPRENKVYLGAVKQLIGHTLVASGLASMVKMALCFQHRQLLAYEPKPKVSELLHIQQFSFLAEHCAWPEDKPLAAISAFGFTGSNAHLVMRNLNIGSTRAASVDETGNQSALLRDSAQQTVPFCVSAANNSSLSLVLAQVASLITADINWNTAVQMACNLLRKPRYQRALVIQAGSLDELRLAVEQARVAVTKNALDKTEQFSPQQSARSPLQQAAQYWWKEQEQALDALEIPAFADQAIRLPGYPFTGERHWVKVPVQTTEQNSSERVVASQADPKTVKSEPESEVHSYQSITTALIAHIAELLGFSPSQLSAQTTIERLGLDSLSAITLLAPYKQAATPLQAHDLFKFHTIDDLARAIAQSMNADKGDKPEEPTAEANLSAADSHSADSEVIPLRWLSVGGDNHALTPLLLMPPLNTGRVAWTQQLQMFRQLAGSAEHSRPIYIPCYPGHNINHADNDASDMPAQFSLQGLCNGVAQFIESELRGAAVDYVGWSLGGCLGLMLAQQQPELIRKLALVSCSARYDQSVFESTLDLHAELAAFSDQLSIVLDSPTDVVQALSAGASMSILKHYYDDLMQFDVSEKLANIQLPTLIIHGEKDVVISEAAIALLQGIPQARVERLPGHGHFSPLTAGRQFNTLLQSFFGRSTSSYN